MNDEDYLKSSGVTDGPEASASTPAPENSAPTAPSVETFEFYTDGKPNKFPVTSEFPITHDGKVLKVPYKNLINSYRQASHYQNKWNAEYKPKIDEFEKLRPEFDKYKGFYDKYGKFQEWSEQNPNEWAKIWDLYSNKDKYLANNGQDYNPLMQEVTALKQHIQELSQFKSEFQKQQETAQAEADVKAVKGEIESFKKDFPEIDLEEADPEGVKLWAKIVNFGIQNNLPDFESAALKFLKSRLIDTVSARARNEAVKGVQKAKQNGEVARSPTPFNLGQGDRKIDFKNKSYNELLEVGRGMLNEAQG